MQHKDEWRDTCSSPTGSHPRKQKPISVTAFRSRGDMEGCFCYCLWFIINSIYNRDLRLVSHCNIEVYDTKLLYKSIMSQFLTPADIGKGFSEHFQRLCFLKRLCVLRYLFGEDMLNCELDECYAETHQRSLGNELLNLELPCYTLPLTTIPCCFLRLTPLEEIW